LPELTGIGAESPLGKQLSDERSSLFLDEYLPGLRPTHGARLLVEKLKTKGMRVVIATSSSEKELQALLRQAEVADLIERATSSADGASKPDPDIVRAALEEGRLAPRETLMVGDTPAAPRSGRSRYAAAAGGTTQRCRMRWRFTTIPRPWLPSSTNSRHEASRLAIADMHIVRAATLE